MTQKKLSQFRRSSHGPVICRRSWSWKVLSGRQALSNIEGASSVHVFRDPSRPKAMTADPFLKSARPGSGLHQPPDARAIHVPEFNGLFVFTERGK